jgi:hypothetical protein
VTEDLVLPERMRKLPVDKHGRPVPWFVAYIDGVPDFRVIRARGIDEALMFKTCWLCGTPLGKYAAFVIGPMCAVNHVSSEPPSHRDCAQYAARACPFLANPNMKRRENNLPEETVDPAGVSIRRNPGVALVWVTRKWFMFRDPKGMPLFDIGAPDQTYWYAHGRDATHDEVVESIETGMPTLRQAAASDGALAAVELELNLREALKLVPA